MRLTYAFPPLLLLSLSAGAAAAQSALCGDSTKRGQERVDACRKELNHHEKSAKAHVALGRALHARREMEQATAEYRRAVELDPHDSGAHLWLGRALSALDQDSASLEEFRLAIAADSGNLNAHAEFVWMLNYLDRHAEGDSALARMRRTMPQNARAYLLLGDLLSTLDRVDESRIALQTAISLEPGNLKAFESLANLYGSQQQFDSAETVLLRGIAAVPGEARSHRALAAFLYRRAEYGRAAAEYDTVSHLDTSDAIAQRWRGDALRSLGRYSEALAAYRASLARDSSSAGGYYDYALGLAAAGDTVAAETAFVASLRRDSLSAAINDGYGELLLNEAKWDAAAPYFQRAVALDSTQRTYLLDLILARFKGGRESEGMRLIDVMIAASPEDASAHLARASLMTSIGKPVEAATSAREAIRLDSTLVDAYLQLALAYMAQDDAAGADQALSAGLSRDSTATGLWSMRGMLYSVLGEHDTAMLYWQRALDLQPRLFEFLPQLEQYYKTSSRAAMEATLPPGMRPPE